MMGGFAGSACSFRSAIDFGVTRSQAIETQALLVSDFCSLVHCLKFLALI